MLLSSSDKKAVKTQRELVKLWSEVFGDEEGYIKLILPYLTHFDCYAIEEKGEIVSAMYLLPCHIKCGNKVYNGRYLYAAATYEKSRKNGYMSTLIREAIEELRDRIDFISLVPANEGLYSYYSRFGFEAVMRNFRTELECNGNSEVFSGDEITDGEYINFLRKDKFDSFHFYDSKTMEYALSCYRYFRSSYRKAKNSVILFVEDEKTVYEGIFAENEKEEFTEFLIKHFSGKISVISPYKINESTKKEKCGMVCAFSDDLKNESEIYMNLTLM